MPKALGRGGPRVSDIDLWEINEAFASVPVAVTRELGIDDAIVNVLGSGCSLGHPVAMTGDRKVLTLIHELRRRGTRGQNAGEKPAQGARRTCCSMGKGNPNRGV